MSRLSESQTYDPSGARVKRINDTDPQGDSCAAALRRPEKDAVLFNGRMKSTPVLAWSSVNRDHD